MNQDPVAQMLTIIRNGQTSNKFQVSVSYSKHKGAILDVLLREGYITAYTAEGTTPQSKHYLVTLSYYEGAPVISHIKRVSKRSRPYYSGHSDLKRVFGGMGTLLVSTPKGVYSDHELRRMAKSIGVKLGGEVIAEVA